MQDYKPTPYLIEDVHLDFLLNEDKSTVKSKLHMTPNYGSASSPPKLELDGEPCAVISSSAPAVLHGTCSGCAHPPTFASCIAGHKHHSI